MGTRDLRTLHAGHHRSDNAFGQPVLQVEDIVERTIEAIGPDDDAGGRFDQLPGDAHPVAALAQTAFEYVAHAKLAAYLIEVDRLPVGEARIARDHQKQAIATAQ